MDKATFLELMDKYIDGTISSDDKYEFDQMFTNDPSLHQEFDIHKTLRKGIKLSGRKDLLSELNEIKKEVSPVKENIKTLFPRWYLMVAAVFVGVIGVVFVLRNQSPVSSNNNSENNYAGMIELKTLPIEGKLGGPSTESIHLILVDNNSETYEIKNDTLFMFTNQEYLDEIKRLKPIFTLNQQRNIVLEIKELTFIFKKKSE